ncbi:helix-turn-helix domain-containing protein [Candidatus Micrarchaeota archaeon]|nr:helix-turn-helix domain-containing protein [Candidatus Micrarchaeota archaeon]
MRADLIQETVTVLEEYGFNVLVYLHSCFDIAAQRKDLTLLVKVLENIDGFREEYADELKKLSASLNASPLVIGEKSKAETLVNNVIYDRYGIPVITLGSLQSTMIGAYPEKVSSKGRVIAEIDGETLRKAREKKHVTAEQLADELNLTKESIYLYENDKIRTKYEIAKRIESFLNANLIKAKKPFQSFAFREEHQSGLGRRLMLMDFDVSSFHRMNFDLFAKDEKNSVVIKQDMAKHPEKVAEFSDFFKTFFAVVSNEKNADVPVVTEEELKSVSNKKDFLKLIKEKR